MPQQKNNTLTEHQQLEMLVDFGKEIANQTQLDDLLALIAKRISQIIGAEH
ncbi:MAG: hypothetical protein LBR90_03905 [Elusimicrobiota bacterium]|jgi:hypothetical protein|nr:hypothetical protein [Elusimicrobiota bacterium]